MVAVTATTAASNAAVLVALRRLRRAPAHYPLASLAIADLLVGLFVLPIGGARELFVIHLNWAICACWSTLDVLCCTASILSLCTLGWERWSCIRAPLAQAKRTKWARILAGLVWPVAAAVALPTGFIPSPRHYHPAEIPKACTVNTNVGYVFFSISFSFYIPAVVMVTLYIYILKALTSPPPIRSHRGRSPNLPTQVHQTPTKNGSTVKDEKSPKKNQITECLATKKCHLKLPGVIKSPLKNLSPSALSRGMLSRQRRATRTIVMLMSLFLFCWMPFFLMLPIDSLCECVTDTIWQWCTWLGYANSALNPLVYAAASPSVRRAIHASLTSSTSRTADVQMSQI